jgi:hypothetical protein
MKIRKSFVSNSSTASFIVVGCKSSDLDLSKEDYKFGFGKNSNVDILSEGELVGIQVASWADDEGVQEIDIDVISKYIEEAKIKIAEFCNKKNIDMPKIKVFGGIEAC